MSQALEPAVPGQLSGVIARGAVRQVVSDEAWLRALIDVEAGLARAEARAGLMTAADAAAIGRACRPEAFDLAALGRAAAETGNPVAPLVRALVAAVHGPAAAQIQRGATSQDIMDTAAMLVVQRALAAVITDLDRTCTTAAGLAAKHRAAPMAGRTSPQQTLPITFGLKAAGWLSGLDESAARLDEIGRRRLAVQLGGAGGTLASLGPAGLPVVGYLAQELGLVAPELPWHSNRTRIAEVAGALGAAAGAIGKPARDVILLAAPEVGEVTELRPGGKVGGSSNRPDRRSPLAAISAASCAARAPDLVTTILSEVVYEHERVAGTWQVEWQPLSDLLVAVGSAAVWLGDSLEHLVVDEQRMRANLELTRGVLRSERGSSLGNTDAFIERALAAHTERRRRTAR
jgi:3-carboxy-cis,cis-muconate cycloisomerase